MKQAIAKSLSIQCFNNHRQYKMRDESIGKEGEIVSQTATKVVRKKRLRKLSTRLIFLLKSKNHWTDRLKVMTKLMKGNKIEENFADEAIGSSIM